MGSFSRVEKTIENIKNTLLNDSVVRKLLFNMVPNALEESDPNISEVESLITKTPMIEYEDGVRDSYKNGFIAIYMSDMERGEVDSFSIVISILVRSEYYELDNKKIRGLTLLDRVCQLLDDKKFNNAAKMTLIGVDSVVIEKGGLIGHFSNWELIDGNNTDF